MDCIWVVERVYLIQDEGRSVDRKVFKTYLDGLRCFDDWFNKEVEDEESFFFEDGDVRDGYYMYPLEERDGFMEIQVTKEGWGEVVEGFKVTLYREEVK